MQDYGSASAYIDALTANQSASALIDWRAIHDTDKARPAIPFRGTLPDCWQSIIHYNNAGYGIFAVVNELDGYGRELVNVRSIRAHFVDLDNLSAQQNYERAAQWFPAPSFAVQTSPGKFHVYWPVVSYVGNDFYTLTQRKLRQYFDGDKSVIDPTRVMRVPGTYHHKGEPHLVTCWTLPGYGYVTSGEQLAEALQAVNVIDGGNGGRRPLGDPELSAPSLDWLRYALSQVDPNKFNRDEWISFTSAFKQAGWLHAGADELFNIWSEWCSTYEHNDLGENLKQWNSIRETEIGWPSIQRRVPAILAMQKFKGEVHTIPQTFDNAAGAASMAGNAVAITVPPMPDLSQPPAGDCRGEILTDQEQRQWFKGCTFVARFGEILDESGRMMNATKFNGNYGGKKFIIDGVGKMTNEPWQAATRSTLWTVPKVDHIRFVPTRAPGDVIVDELGRKGINTYKPADIEAIPGDVALFLHHMQLMIPDTTDREMLLAFLAHNAKFPGYKIPWAPLLQSAEGVGKGVLKRVMRHVMGGPYVHFPNAQELIESGSKFNAWMRAKLFILVDEIKVDERRDMIEVLKPMISEAEIEIQGKGHDQDKEDNYSNWAFFSNYKDAIPINKNGRRFAIFYSAIQSLDDLKRRNMGEDYFNRLYGWLDREGGVQNVAHWLLQHPIERGTIPMRAPDTSSTREAMRQSRGPVEQAILDGIEDQLQGFRGGWVSVLGVMARLRALGMKQPAAKTVTSILEGLGYFHIGRSPRAFFQESAHEKSQLYNVLRDADVSTFGKWQGYE